MLIYKPTLKQHNTYHINHLVKYELSCSNSLDAYNIYKLTWYAIYDTFIMYVTVHMTPIFIKFKQPRKLKEKLVIVAQIFFS